MARKYLATYLNDHLAGSSSVLELLEHLASAYAGSETERFAAELRAEVYADREELEGLMGRLEVSQSVPRRASAWVAEKLARLKLQLDDPAAGALRLLESMDAISLGIEGKRELWAALAATAETDPGLRGLDYGRLQQRAKDQRSRVEVVRIEAATAALISNL